MTEEVIIFGEEYRICCEVINSAVVGFQVFKSMSIIGDPMEFRIRGELNCMITTPDLGKAARYAEGHVKWDGCADFQFEPDDNVMIHTCSPKQALALGQVMIVVYRIASTMLTNCDYLDEMPEVEL